MGRAVKYVLAFGLAFVVGLAALDVFLRVSGTSAPSVTVDDPTFGRMMKPGVDVVFINEGFKLGQINEYGYMGRGYPPVKPHGVVRIALMGDSYVAGHHLFDRHHFGTLLEHDLNDMVPYQVQVLNFGFPAVNFEQMYIYYRVFAKRFSPDYVLYFIGPGSLNMAADEIGPRLKIEGDSLRIDYAFRSSAAFARSRRMSPIRELALYPLARKAMEMHARGLTMDVIFDKFYRLFASVPSVETGEEPVERPKRQPINRAIVDALASANRSGAATSIIVARDSLPDTFIDFVKARGVRILDPAPSLDSLAAQGIDPNYWPGSHRRGHWNPYAHRVIADFLAAEMLPLLKERTSLDR
jgi:hypothetical protein